MNICGEDVEMDASPRVVYVKPQYCLFSNEERWNRHVVLGEIFFNMSEAYL